MWITCLRDNLSRALTAVSRAVSSRSMLPVTQNVLLESNNGQLKITATNTEISISTWIGAKIEHEGSITIPARILTDYVNALVGEEIRIDLLDDPDRVKVLCGSADATINGISSDEFPPIPEVSSSHPAQIDAETFRSSLRRVVVAAATDDSRPVLTGVKVDLSGNRYTLAAADGFRLAVETGSLLTEVGEDIEIIVPAKTFSEIERLLSDGSQSIQMSVDSDSRAAKFKLDSSEVVTSLVQGTFPDYNKLIPSIDAQVEGEGTKVAFNSKFLREVLGVLDGQEIIIETDSSSGPGVFRSESNPGYTHVVMPMFVQW